MLVHRAQEIINYEEEEEKEMRCRSTAHPPYNRMVPGGPHRSGL